MNNKTKYKYLYKTKKHSIVHCGPIIPCDQLCSQVPIMLPPTNYAQNYASIIGKALFSIRTLFNGVAVKPYC